MIRYYIEIKHPQTTERIAGELITDESLSEIDLTESIMGFAEDENICPSWALENCKYKVEVVNDKTMPV